MNPFVNAIERYKHELSDLTFDIKTLEKYRVNIGSLGRDLSIEDMTGLFYMKGQVKILEDVINQLATINSMVEFE